MTMDTAVEATMTVHRKDGSLMHFREQESGLYAYDTSQKEERTEAVRSNQNVADYTYVQTVANQKKLFTAREVKAADAALALYRKIHWVHKVFRFLWYRTVK